LRQQIDELIASGNVRTASRRLAELWREENGPAAASFVVSRYEKLRSAKPLVPYRLAILRSFTLEPVVPLLRAAAFVAGIDLTVSLGGFNTYPQEILESSSPLYSFAPDAAILAVQTRDVAPDLYDGYANLTPDAVEVAIKRVVNSFRAWLRAFRERTQANLIVHTLEQPAIPSTGVLDATETGQSAAIRTINDGLRSLCRENLGVYLLDYDALIARHGRLNWRDEKKWLTARMPIRAGHLVDLAKEWLRFVVPLAGKSAKALVVDLDNTLWGGIIGEDGINGIQLGPDHIGAAYQAVQRLLLDLHHKGILLAICSKNNLDDVKEVLEKHSGMLLRPEHFAALRINWNDKAQSLVEIAAELNIGIDALAFLDDNPVERENIRTSLPEVSVIDVPSDPFLYADALRDSPVFERLTLSAEDRQRTGFYTVERQRSQAEEEFSSKEDFYRFLNQEAEVASVEPSTLARVSQLTQKTNQFNLTTRRRGEQQIAEIAARSDWRVVSLRVRDRYGNHGLVGVAITQDQGDSCEIDSFLLSCRVIGRTVETALLSHLAESARFRHLKYLRGWFFPTKKNAPAKDFYLQHGFTVESRDGEGTLWVLDLQSARVDCPDWIKMSVLAGERN
jgi:FkbH-like protein